jgi:pectin methylesterase-like acyl-CoA thioesterase
MRAKALFLTAAICVLYLTFLPNRLMAKTLTVNPADTTCGTTSNPDCRTTIEAALSAAIANDSILVEPGTYHEQVTLRNDIAVSLQGRETARTILTGDGTGTIITANGVTAETSISDSHLPALWWALMSQQFKSHPCQQRLLNRLGGIEFECKI